MDGSERLSALIGRIYDAALDPTLWVDVLDAAARFVGGSASSLYYRDAAGRSPDVAYQTGLHPRYVQLYVDTYSKLDPTLTGYYFAKLEEPTATADVIPYDEFVQTRFYKEWARPQKLVDTANAILERSAGGAAGFVVFRHERHGLVDDEVRRRMRLIVPHFRRAVLIGKTLGSSEARSATFAEAFDSVSAAMFLVEADGRIVHANAAGRIMLDVADVLRVDVGRIVASDPQSDLTLIDIVAAASEGDVALGIKGIAAPLNAIDGTCYIAHVLPLTSGARRQTVTNYAPVAALLFVHKAALEIPSPPAAIATAYKLTPMELRVLLAIVEVGGVPQVAEALGVAETTVRTHLGHLYRKTGGNRQADLVKIVGGFSNPLVR